MKVLAAFPTPLRLQFDNEESMTNMNIIFSYTYKIR